MALPIPYKIIICEDHDVVVQGVKLMLSDVVEFSLCGHAKDEMELVQLIEREAPKVLLLDLNLNGQDGFRLMEMVRAKHPALKVIIFTMYEDTFLIEKARKLKASGYLLKNSSGQELIECLNHAVQSAEFYLPVGLLNQKQKNDSYRDEFVEKMHLTPREIEIIKLAAQGKSAKEMADELFLSLHTIDTHRRNVLLKLKMKNIADLVRFAAKNNLI